MKITDRIKRALAGALSKELIPYIINDNLSHWNLGNIKDVHYTPEVRSLECRIAIQNHERYEKLLREAKRRLADEIMKEIEVDTHRLISHEHHNNRALILSLKIYKRAQ